MTLGKVMERVKALKLGYEIDDEALISYIDAAESMIMQDIVRGREGEEAADGFNGYDMNTGRETALFAPSPYDRLYEQYAATQIDLREEESERYINDMAAFRDTYLELKRYWWQTHRQKKNYQYHF